MKILVLIPNYIDESRFSRLEDPRWQLDVVTRQIDEFNSFKDIELDIMRFTTEEGMNYRFDTTHDFMYPKELKHAFPYVTKEWVDGILEFGDEEGHDLLDKYDYVLYTEDDLLITEAAVKEVIGLQNVLDQYESEDGKAYVAGFIRYERKKDGSIIYIDMHPAHSVHRGGKGTVKDRFKFVDKVGYEIEAFEPWNIHSGCWLLSVENVRWLIKNGKFITKPTEERKYCGPLESAATEIYFDFTRVYPNDVSVIAIEHMHNKYPGLTKEALDNEIHSS